LTSESGLRVAVEATVGKNVIGAETVIKLVTVKSVFEKIWNTPWKAAVVLAWVLSGITAK
jgi:hypothetical protein